ncbi:hypothetical protein T492DRAFT_887966 [Pavlovales sp. CCMP2436]|nr:hypothetical protein T492DRAFT_887966 [Pavlovales sp. CCMP2436]
MAAVWSAADWAEKGPEASAEAGPVAGATEEDTGKAEEGPEASAKAGPVAEATEEDAGKAGQEATGKSEVQAEAGADGVAHRAENAVAVDGETQAGARAEAAAEMAAAAEAAAKAGAWTEAAAEAEAAYELHDSYSIEHKRALQRHTARASELLDALQPASLREHVALAFLRGKVLDASPAQANTEHHLHAQQKKPHVLSGHKVKPRTTGTGKKDKASAAAPPPKPSTPAATDPGSSADGA